MKRLNDKLDTLIELVAVQAIELEMLKEELNKHPNLKLDIHAASKDFEIHAGGRLSRVISKIMILRRQDLLGVRVGP